MKKNLIFFLPNFSPGGAGKSITSLCEHLNKKKYNLYIISLNKNYYKNKLKKFCKKIYEIDNQKTAFSFIKILEILKNFNQENSIFISNINYANVLSIIYLKMLSSYKLVITERTPFQELNFSYGFIDFFKKKIIKTLIFFLYKKSDLIICNSKRNSKDLSKFVRKKCHYVYPIFSKKINKNSKLNKKSKNFNILSIGRFSKEKNFQDIIKAVSLTNNSNIKLVLLGKGKEEKKLRNYAEESKIKYKIILYTKKSEMKYLKESHLYINSSDFEGFPNAVLDGINNNLPIIATESYGGIYEILLNEKGGTLYEKNNVRDLSKKIVLIKNNYIDALKKNNLAKSKLKRFSPKKSIYQFESLIEKIK